MFLAIFPSKKSSNISFQTSPEVRHQFRRKLRQLHSGNRWCLPFGNGKGGHYERGLFTGGISRISNISKLSRISRKWSDSPLLSTVWGFFRISKFSRISRKSTYLKRPLFHKTPFSEPDPFSSWPKYLSHPLLTLGVLSHHLTYEMKSPHL